jgi:hypothetical protein
VDREESETQTERAPPLRPSPSPGGVVHRRCKRRKELVSRVRVSVRCRKKSRGVPKKLEVAKSSALPLLPRPSYARTPLI